MKAIDALNPQIGMVVEYNHIGYQGKFMVRDVVGDQIHQIDVVYDETEQGSSPVFHQKVSLHSWKILVGVVVRVTNVYMDAELGATPSWEV